MNGAFPRWIAACVLGALVVGAVSRAAATGNAERPRNVLVLSSTQVTAGMVLREAFQTTLTSRSPDPVNFYIENLDLAAPGVGDIAKQVRDLLLRKYARTPIDLVALTHSQTLAFAVEHRRQLFHGAPIVFAAVDRRAAAKVRLPHDATGVWLALPWAETLRAALRLQPDTRRVVVVGGTSASDRTWLTDATVALAPFRSRVQIDVLAGPPLDDVLARVADLPPHTIVVLGAFLRDGAGVSYAGPAAAARIAAASRVPCYSVNELLVGMGIVGGRVASWREQGMKAAELGLALMGGQRPPAVDGPSRFVFDWRQLRRWGLDERRVPSGSEVRFREPPAWVAYRWAIIAGVAVVATQTALIAGLLVQRARRRHAQRGLAQRLRFETLLSELSATFVAVPVGDVARHVEQGLRRLVEELGVDRASLVEFDGAGAARVTHAWTRAGLEPLPSPGTDRAFPWIALAVKEGRAVRCRDVDDLPAAAAVDRQTLLALGIRAFVSVPLQAAGVVRGVLSLGVAHRQHAWASDLVVRLRLLAEVFANVLALADSHEALRVSHARARDLAARVVTAQEEERRRLSLELHDDVNQKVAALALRISALGRRLPASDAMREELGTLQHRTMDLASDVRRLSHELHPAVLEHAGFATALASHCAELRGSGIDVILDLSSPLDGVTGDVALCLYRVTQEALANVIKHADSRRARVTGSVEEGWVNVAIRDEGVGFDVAARRDDGLGLHGMAERARMLGGTVRIRSTPGSGTEVTVRVPLQS